MSEDRRVQILLVRHGESLWNAEGRVQGQHGTGLSPQGTQQAADVAEHLAQLVPSPTVIVSSDLERVQQTAEPYLSRVRRSADIDQRLREIDTGRWSGRLRSELPEDFHAEVAAIRRGEEVVYGGGESYTDLRTRVATALGDAAHAAVAVAGTDDSATVLTFTHGGPIQVAAAEALGLPTNQHIRLQGPVNCSVTTITVAVPSDGTDLSMRLRSYNERHLCRRESAGL